MVATAKHSSAVAASEKRPLLLSSESNEKFRVPQTIAHRGFSAIAPENTMAAFEAAAKAGVEAIETDLHLTRDGVVVLSHDETLQRCFGNSAKVRDLTWSEISQFRTLKEPHQRMPRLIDLLEFLDQPGREDIWLMLDIKTHDDAEEMMQRLAQTLASAPGKKPWCTRVTPACWNATYIKLSLEYLHDYRPMHVGFSTMYARCLTDVPNISFSILRHTLASPLGDCFIRDMKQLGIPVYAWTLDKENWMEWGIRKELSGIITDEVDLFHKVCDRMSKGEGQALTIRSWSQASGLNSLFRSLQFWSEVALFQLIIFFHVTKDWVKHGSPSHSVNKALNG